MWRVEARGHAPAPDLDGFVATINAHADFFDRGRPIVVARAPGRLDLMGGIADYSGSLVLELPLAAATFAAIQLTDDRCLTVRSLAAKDDVSCPIERLAPGGVALEYADAKELLASSPEQGWAAYVLGALVVLAREQHLALGRGIRLLVDSTVPLGKGVSSSAALEVAAMSALAAAHGLSLGARDLALLCQTVENRVVGAPCGIMDQMTAAAGERDRLLALLCQPAELLAQVPLPPELEVWGIDSGIRHEVGGTDYGRVRVGAFMGYRIVADALGFDVTPLSEGRVRIDDPQWHGYLANVSPAEWESTLRKVVPERMNGAAFLRQYVGITDSVTSVDAHRTYAVRHPTAHPIYEHHRVRRFRELMETGAGDEDRRIQLGALMYQSHASYSDCGLGSSGTDRLVSLVRDAGPAAGLYGAKITGGGSGGVVAVLARAGSRGAVEAIARKYVVQTGRAAVVLGGSSDGAARFGVVLLENGYQ